ncbi:GNAT family N-acetyltransferase [Dyadobacter sp. CY261]|uniref:GNAT family N-acetyltransferase n=1 Tax=Dyadobacter sp. CY261 TaxID=2907203 RepID=UPI001F1BB241|nr:GNAT family N-acetyltransferase [Dyadobacter sp. CY261]MCF0075440.1 GNAT family N-acetyltransferase [Dyadobacter sp. CY261]
MIEFDFIPFHDVMLQIAEKVTSHEQEVEYYGDANVDWNYYMASSMAGQCFAVVIKDDGYLVGYSVFTIGGNPNHKHLIEASNTALYLDKEYRGKIGREMFAYAQKRLFSMGVNEISYAVKNERIGNLLRRFGYAPEHTVWSMKNE